MRLQSDPMSDRFCLDISWVICTQLSSCPDIWSSNAISRCQKYLWRHSWTHYAGKQTNKIATSTAWVYLCLSRLIGQITLSLFFFHGLLAVRKMFLKGQLKWMSTTAVIGLGSSYRWFYWNQGNIFVSDVLDNLSRQKMSTLWWPSCQRFMTDTARQMASSAFD